MYKIIRLAKDERCNNITVIILRSSEVVFSTPEKNDARWEQLCINQEKEYLKVVASSVRV